MRHRKGWIAAFDTQAGYIASEEEKGPPIGIGSHKGVHGLWPTHANYRSSFLICGEGVSNGRLPEISILQIAPTFAEILGVGLPAAKEPSLWPQIRK